MDNYYTLPYVKVYVVIPSHDGVSDSERADKIAIEWWSITRPDSVSHLET